MLVQSMLNGLTYKLNAGIELLDSNYSAITMSASVQERKTGRERESKRNCNQMNLNGHKDAT